MTGSRVVRSCLEVALAVLLGTPGVCGQEGAPVVVEPVELTKRPNLVGREVQVDDRVSRFQYHREGGFDQIFLTRAPEVSFELPARLRPSQNPSVAAVKIRGVLHREGGRWWVDVSGFEPQPADLDRLNRAVALLPATDTETRTAWARWAEQRGESFHDPALLKRSREIEGDAIRAESDRTRGTDPGSHWLALAERARSRKVAEPEPSAQAHRGFRAALAASKTAEELKGLLGKIEGFFPASKEPVTESPDLSRWEKPYSSAPADAYRSAPPDARRALDHRLWADATQTFLERRAAEEPGSLLTLAEEAARLLPDRPQVGTSFLERGLSSAATEVGALRQAEVDTLARLYTEKLGKPDKARELYRAWLDDQKNRRMSERDAEGRIRLAEQYETLLDDRATAVGLLREAWSIDPQSREVADAFRRRGFRKVKGEWARASRTNAPGGETAARAETPDRSPVAAPARETGPTPGSAGPTESLRGATQDEVRTRMGGKPNRKVRVATQGQSVEQWVYFGQRLNQYVNFLQRPGDPHPRVVSYYSLPRGAGDPRPSP